MSTGGPLGMFEDLNTKVHDIRELVDWLDEHPGPPDRSADWDPEATGIMKQPELDEILAAEQARAGAKNDFATVSGSLEAFHVVELLQALCGSARTGVLTLEDGPLITRIHVDDGRISASSSGDDDGGDAMEHLRAAARMRSGEFWFGPGDDAMPRPAIVVTSTMSVLLELSQIAWELSGGVESVDDEEMNFDAFNDPITISKPRPPLGRMQSAPLPVDLPPAPTGAMAAFGARPLRLADPLVPRLRELSPEELDVLQGVLRHRTLDAATAALGGDPSKTRALLLGLLARGYLIG